MKSVFFQKPQKTILLKNMTLHAINSLTNTLIKADRICFELEWKIVAHSVQYYMKFQYNVVLLIHAQAQTKAQA